MGWWRSSHGIIGDWPADILDKALREIEAVYQTECKRKPTQGEIANLVEFCSCGTLRPECGDPKREFSTETLDDDATPRAVKRGDQGAFGDAAQSGPGMLANVDPATGNHYEQSEMAHVLREEMRRRAGRPDPRKCRPIPG